MSAAAAGNAHATSGGPPAFLEESGDAFFHDYDFIFDSGRAGFLIQQLQRLVDRFVREAEGAVVHGNHPPRLEVEKGSRSIRGIGMHVAKLRRIVSADRKQRELRSEASPDLAKPRKIRGVARVIDGVLARFQHEAAVAPMRILQNPRAPVARGHVGYRQIAVARSLPPVELDDLGKPEVGDQVRDMRRNDDRRRFSTSTQIMLYDRAQRRAMQVVEVRVRYEYQVNRRKIGYAQARTAKAFQHKQPPGKIGIDHHALAPDLHEKAGVSDEGDAEFSVRGKPRFVGLAAAWCDCRSAHQSSELGGALA